QQSRMRLESHILRRRSHAGLRSAPRCQLPRVPLTKNIVHGVRRSSRCRRSAADALTVKLTSAASLTHPAFVAVNRVAQPGRQRTVNDAAVAGEEPLDWIWELQKRLMVLHFGIHSIHRTN